MDLIMMPILDINHWRLLVIDMVAKSIFVLDSGYGGLDEFIQLKLFRVRIFASLLS